MKRAIFLLPALLGAALLPAQDRGLARIVVERTGLYQVRAADLLACAPELAEVDPDQLALFREGRQVPIQVRGGADRHLDPHDGILFFGERGRGPHSQRTCYVLGTAKRTRRIRKVPGSTGEAADAARNRVTLEEDRIHHPLATVRQDVLRAQERPELWFWKRIPASGAAQRSGGGEPHNLTSVAVMLDAPPHDRLAAELELHLLGPVVDGVSQKVRVTVNGKEVGTAGWTRGLRHVAGFKVPAGLLRRSNVVQIANLSPDPTYTEPENELARSRPNELLLDRLVLTYDTLLMGPGVEGEQILYTIPAGRERRGLRFESLHHSGQIIYDVERGVIPRNHVVTPGDEDATRVCCLTGQGWWEPAEVARLRPTRAHLPGPGAEYVVVTTSRLKPALKPLLSHREAGGLSTLVVEARELYDTFTHGRFDPAAVTAFMQAAWRNWETKPRYLLLVGDADLDVDWFSTKETLPTRLVMTDYNGATATDALFGDVDGDGLPEVAVGRLPARRKMELLDVCQRIVDLEKRPPPGSWRRRVGFVAGEARFNPVVDRLLEGVLRRVVSGTIPPAFRVSMTYANPRSPYYWPAASFSRKFVERLNRGSLVVTYLGHGATRSLDYVRTKNGIHPILGARDVKSVDSGGRNPVLAIIACWTGRYDLPGKDAIGELLLLKDGGPAAVIAASRISHPFPNALLGKALAAEFFAESRALGDILLAARRRMLEEGRGGPLALLAAGFLSKAVKPETLVKDHVYLYNLLGDPALRVPMPECAVTLETRGEAVAGRPLAVSGRLEGGSGATLELSLERPVDRLPPGVPAMREEPAAPGDALQVAALHDKVNDPVVAASTVDLEGEAFTATLDLPPGLAPGPYVLRAYATGRPSGDAAGALRLEVTAPEPAPASRPGNR